MAGASKIDLKYLDCFWKYQIFVLLKYFGYKNIMLEKKNNGRGRGWGVKNTQG